MPNPLEAAEAFLVADASNLPNGTTYSVDEPATSLAGTHVQFAWDGSPSDADNREDATVRFTVWGSKADPIAPQDVASGLRARLILWSSTDVWRVNRGAGRLPGFDRDLELPFCTFTVLFAMHANTP